MTAQDVFRRQHKETQRDEGNSNLHDLDDDKSYGVYDMNRAHEEGTPSLQYGDGNICHYQQGDCSTDPRDQV